MNIILASGSPRRKEILEMLGTENLIVRPAKGEERAPEGAGPGEIVEALASAKAEEIARGAAADDAVIAADTIVWFRDRVFGKPHSVSEAVEMLEALSGNFHEVYTGVAVIRNGKLSVEHEVTRVFFREMTPSEIEAYVATGEPMDKAGAYGAQGKGSMFVERIEGDFFNVMGLPVCRLGRMLEKQGVRLI